MRLVLGLDFVRCDSLGRNYRGLRYFRRINDNELSCLRLFRPTVLGEAKFSALGASLCPFF